MKEKTSTPHFDIDAIMADEKKKAKLDVFVDELVEHNKKIGKIKEDMKIVRDDAKESLGIPPRVLNKFVKAKLSPDKLLSEAKDVENAQHYVGQLDSDPTE